MDNNISKETKEFLNLFYQPEFSEFDFICLFISLLKLENIHTIDTNQLESFIINNKYNQEFKDILKKFKYKSNGIYKYSNQFREVIRLAKYSGLIFSISPEIDGLVFIKKDIDIKELIKGKEEYIDTMKYFINQIYDLNYETKIRNYAYVDAPGQKDYVENKSLEDIYIKSLKQNKSIDK